MKKLLLALALLAATGPTYAPAQTAPSTATKPAAAPPAAAPQPLSQSVTDKHPYAVYFILIAASLAAVASLASSSLTAWVTWKSKDKEYKNDYYKKVIDKRIKAVEAAEALLSLFSSYYTVGPVDKVLVYFTDNLGSGKLEEKLLKVGDSTLWYSKKLENKLSAFSTFIIEKHDEANEKLGPDGEHTPEWRDYCISVYGSIHNEYEAMLTALHEEMIDLHEIDKYLKFSKK